MSMKTLLPYGNKQQKILLEGSKSRSRSNGKKTIICKILKKPHQFTLFKETRHKFMKSVIQEYRCICGKKKIDYGPINV